jgi:hypothetical protein
VQVFALTDADREQAPAVRDALAGAVDRGRTGDQPLRKGETWLDTQPPQDTIAEAARRQRRTPKLDRVIWAAMFVLAAVWLAGVAAEAGHDWIASYHPPESTDQVRLGWGGWLLLVGAGLLGAAIVSPVYRLVRYYLTKAVAVQESGSFFSDQLATWEGKRCG